MKSFRQFVEEEYRDGDVHDDLVRVGLVPNNVTAHLGIKSHHNRDYTGDHLPHVVRNVLAGRGFTSVDYQNFVSRDGKTKVSLKNHDSGNVQAVTFSKA